MSDLLFIFLFLFLIKLIFRSMPATEELTQSRNGNYHEALQYLINKSYEPRRLKLFQAGKTPHATSYMQPNLSKIFL